MLCLEKHETGSVSWVGGSPRGESWERPRLAQATHLVGHFQRQESFHDIVEPVETIAMRDRLGGEGQGEAMLFSF